MSELSKHLEKVLLKINSIKKKDKILLFIRHSTREEINPGNLMQSFYAAVTEEGKALAIEFGKKLPLGMTYRFFYSPAPRCIDTAVYMITGIEEKGGVAMQVGSRNYLAAPYLRDPIKSMEVFFQNEPHVFFKRWADGSLDPFIIYDYKESNQKLFSEVFNESNLNKKDEIDIFITHDLTIVTLLNRLYPVTKKDFIWPGFLEGILIRKGLENFYVDYLGEEKELIG